jgi:hypothetical protein
MGKEAVCTVRSGGRSAQGKALLETDDLVFRGGFRLAIPLASLTSVKVHEGWLAVEYPDGSAEFELGLQAAKWADRILHPPSLLDRLDVKPTSHVATLGVADQDFLRDLRARTPHVSTEGGRDQDLVFLQADDLAALDRLKKLEAAIARDGGIWVIAPKGRRDIREMDVLNAGRAAGLKDVKVARFSDTHTTHKFVIPRERR